MSDSTIATCTEHHEGRIGRIHSSLAGLSSPKAGFASVCTHPLTHPRQSEGNLTIPNKLRDLPRWYGIPSRCTTGEWKRTAIVAARVRVYWFPFSWGSVSTHTHTHSHSHTVSICNSIAPHGRARPRAVTQMALGDLQMTYLPQSVSSPRGLVQFTTYYTQIYPSDGGWRVNKGGWAVRSTGMRLHNSGNLIKMCTERAMCSLRGWCFVVVASWSWWPVQKHTQHTNQSSTFGHRRNQAERIHRELSGLAMVDVWWPVLGRMHVADGERQDSRSGT